MNFSQHVNAAVARLKKDGVFLTAGWTFGLSVKQEQKNKLWRVADHVRTGEEGAKIVPNGDHKLVWLGSEKQESGLYEQKYFAFVPSYNESDRPVFLKVSIDQGHRWDGETVYIVAKPPEYMLQKFAPSDLVSAGGDY